MFCICNRCQHLQLMDQFATENSCDECGNGISLSSDICKDLETFHARLTADENTAKICHQPSEYVSAIVNKAQIASVKYSIISRFDMHESFGQRKQQIINYTDLRFSDPKVINNISTVNLSRKAFTGKIVIINTGKLFELAVLGK